tara:strand:- start:320 stop:715 length:396 start_codon:yes stop_codon:yes gene_type:complete
MAKSKGRLLAELLSSNGIVKSDRTWGRSNYTGSSSSITEQAIASFDKDTYRTAKYTIQVTNSTDTTYHITELLITHSGSTTHITEYGTIFTGAAPEANFTADISGDDVRLLATATSTDALSYKIMLQTIEV